MTTSAAPATHVLEVPGVALRYDVRGELEPHPLMLIGSPMSAAGFGTLSGFFADRCVVTYDPRGVDRSVRTDDQTESTPAQHASDVAAIIEALGVESVDLFASSGGAVNALALVAERPELVRTLVAHEPPLIQVLPDREAAQAVVDDMHATYLAHGQGRAMAKFIACVSHQGPFTGPMPDLDPAQFGMPDVDDGRRDDPLLHQNHRGLHAFVPDAAAIRAASTRVMLAYGTETGDAMTARSTHAVAAHLGIEPTAFPSHHAGFLGGEFGQQGDPEAFAARLREVL